MQTLPALTEASVWRALEEIPDPELPVVNLVELGIVRAIRFNADAVQVVITPTFAGCPAYEVMSEQIRARIEQEGAARVEVVVRHDPPWTSEWITEAARAKLKAAGLAPPPRHTGNLIQVLLEPVACPRCESTQTSLRNSFGTTPCRMIYTCNNCLEPFELFKPL
ncbi:MAG: phenylacetate-CoA oxygenase subunit PaaJ [Chloroflexi bacterium]|nr:phenylacetate-CoA oxygenase subunit PaaJ [Chloroflexota bacterium]